MSNKESGRQPMAKWQVAQVYRAYLSREGPQNLGTIEWPQPKSGCLKGVKVLSTGIFETIEREQLVDLLTGCGARYYAGMSPHLDYLLVGRDAGPVKLQVAEEKGIPQLSEEQFYTWIKEKIDNYVPTADDAVDDKTSGKKGTGKKGKAAAVTRPKSEPKPRKAPAARKPVPEFLEYDSDESSGSDDELSDEEKEKVSDEDEEEVIPEKKKRAAPAKKPARGKTKAPVKAEPEEEDADVVAVKGKKTVVNKSKAAVKSEPEEEEAEVVSVKAKKPAVRKSKAQVKAEPEEHAVPVRAKRTAAKPAPPAADQRKEADEKSVATNGKREAGANRQDGLKQVEAAAGSGGPVKGKRGRSIETARRGGLERKRGHSHRLR